MQDLTQSTKTGKSLKSTPAPAPVEPGQASEQSAQLSRRSFLRFFLAALGTLAAVEAGAASLLYLKPRDLKEDFGGVVTAGKLEEFPTGSVTEFPEGRFFLVRAQDGGLLAIYYRCPHLGCTVSWVAERERFYCPCHASSFDQFGDFNNSPVPRALDLFAVQVEDGEVKIDTSRLVRRDRFNHDQLVYG